MSEHSGWTQDKLLDGIAVLRGSASQHSDQQRAATVKQLREMTPHQRRAIGVSDEEFQYWDYQCERLLARQEILHAG